MYRRAVLVGLCLTAVASLASAQTSVTINTPARAADTTLRGGSSAATNFGSGLLVTRASSNAEYVRRSLIDFDTETTIPVGATIQSATLTITVHAGGIDPLRGVGIYPVRRAFTASQATWDIANSTTPWTTPGGDLGAGVTSGNVPNAPGAKATFNVTALVQAAVRSTGSRHTRAALVDIDSLTDARDGYRDYYSMEATDPTVRPTLVVTYGGATTPSPTGLPNFSHVFVILFENHEYGQIIGNAAAPYFNSLARKYGLATNYDGIMHPSLPNYMALTSGKTAFTTDCIGCTSSAASIADQVEQSGRTWRGYMETMPAPCTATDSGLYVAKHNPFVHYANLLGNRTRCEAHVIAKTPLLGHLRVGDVANYTWITPNMCNDMHDCSVPTGDAWLQKYVTAILASPAWDANSVIFITFDEGTSATGGGGRIPLIVVSPRTPAGTIVTTTYNHYNLLATIEDAWGLPRLGNAAGRTAMREFFR